MLARIMLAIALAGAGTSACEEDESVTLTDSEGRVFAARCDKEGDCKLERRSGPSWPGGKGGLALSTAGRVVGICNVQRAGEAPESPADCRALRCQTDADCPPAYGLEKGSCLAGICTDESHPLGPRDAVMLCLWGTGLGRDAPAQVERFAMAHNCGSPCEIPAPCRQP